MDAFTLGPGLMGFGLNCYTLKGGKLRLKMSKPLDNFSDVKDRDGCFVCFGIDYFSWELWGMWIFRRHGKIWKNLRADRSPNGVACGHLERWRTLAPPPWCWANILCWGLSKKIELLTRCERSQDSENVLMPWRLEFFLPFSRHC